MDRDLNITKINSYKCMTMLIGDTENFSLKYDIL